jgi:hypothetical protein
MDKPRIEKLLADPRVSPDEKLRVRAHWNASMKTLKALDTTPNATTQRDAEATEGALLRLVEDIEARVYRTEHVYENRLAALAALRREGWKIGKSKLYRDCKDGLLKVQSDGSVLESELEKYIRRARLERLESMGADKVSDDIRARKEKASAEREEYQARLAAVKAAAAEGMYVERAQVEHQLGARAAIFKSDGQNWIQSHAGEMVATVDGDHAKAADLVEMMLKGLEAWLDRYSQPLDFTVPGADDEEADAQ